MSQMPVTHGDNVRFIRYCDFCGATPESALCLIHANDRDICDRCVEQCMDIVRERREEKAKEGSAG